MRSEGGGEARWRAVLGAGGRGPGVREAERGKEKGERRKEKVGTISNGGCRGRRLCRPASAKSEAEPRWRAVLGAGGRGPGVRKTERGKEKGERGKGKGESGREKVESWKYQ